MEATVSARAAVVHAPIMAGLPNGFEHMSMTIYETIKAALLAKKAVVIVRDGVERYVCPHVIGTKYEKKTGRLRQNCLFYQWAGESESGLGPDRSDLNWRCMHIDEIESVKVLEGEPWHTVDVLPTKMSFCVDLDKIDAKVWL
jgi:hypothetical protein